MRSVDRTSTAAVRDVAMDCTSVTGELCSAIRRTNDAGGFGSLVADTRTISKTYTPTMFEYDWDERT